MKSDKDNDIENEGAGSFIKAPGCHTPAELYNLLYGVAATEIPIACGGGDRKYSRLCGVGVPSVIGTTGPDMAENRAFVCLAEVFRRNDIRVPEIFIADEDFHSYLQSDFGDISLLSLLSTSKRMELSQDALLHLVKIQTVEEKEWLPFVYSAPFSRRMIMWDLNYFKYEFVKPCGIVFDEDKLEDDFEHLSDRLSLYDAALWGFMYRDFQSRNIIIKDDRSHFIDFQGGRKGPGLYDAVSFLWQAKANFSREERDTLLDFYASAYSEVRGINKERVLANVGLMALLRTLQVLGAYGFRGLVEKRAHFIESIPPALGNLSELIAAGVVRDFPELERVCIRLIGSRFAVIGKRNDLTVSVFSFSYKRGYPEDLSGNGGGFMFDCRGMHNPGRYEQYKPLTGLDNEVIEFLEAQGEVQAFLENAHSLVAPCVSRYQQRGFNSLQIGFGCTGGRHRSVYCAQHLADRLAQEFPGVRIVLNHREQGIKKTYNDSFHI
ncbi:MAG: phosphotransferase [Bacteroides sp.]|nr:phosphotransferase [Bacteroides sp.]